MYVGPRIANFSGGVSNDINARGTILAGCSRATMAKVLVYWLLKSFNGKNAGLHFKTVVDDVSLQVVGTSRSITKTLADAGAALADGIEELRLLLSLFRTDLWRPPCSFPTVSELSGMRMALE